MRVIIDGKWIAETDQEWADLQKPNAYAEMGLVVAFDADERSMTIKGDVQIDG